jgi:hypothetical protein
MFPLLRSKARLPLFEDFDHGEGPLLENYGLKCPECGYEDSYQPEHYFHENQDDGFARKNTSQEH